MRQQQSTTYPIAGTGGCGGFTNRETTDLRGARAGVHGRNGTAVEWALEAHAGMGLTLSGRRVAPPSESFEQLNTGISTEELAAPRGCVQRGRFLGNPSNGFGPPPPDSVLDPRFADRAGRGKQVTISDGPSLPPITIGVVKRNSGTPRTFQPRFPGNEHRRRKSACRVVGHNPTASRTQQEQCRAYPPDNHFCRSRNPLSPRNGKARALSKQSWVQCPNAPSSSFSMSLMVPSIRALLSASSVAGGMV